MFMYVQPFRIWILEVANHPLIPTSAQHVSDAQESDNCLHLGAGACRRRLMVQPQAVLPQPQAGRPHLRVPMSPADQGRPRAHVRPTMLGQF